jgi:hypothetical protein
MNRLEDAGRGRQRSSSPFDTDQEDRTEPSDLDLIAVAESGPFDPFPIDVHAVEGAHVSDLIAVATPHKLAVSARHGDPIQEDMAVGVPAALDTWSSRTNREPALGPRSTISTPNSSGRWWMGTGLSSPVLSPAGSTPSSVVIVRSS